ncbi:uncharacterized protein LOC126374137 [Pectinophora gossypiella]|uniref:uncharacterized protein LOC126374137 n=1 Tax=Pectinophora gossypiella TaxID=13191 RepID=UPI00214EAD8D|nr:uncharacterized protein LOC126374137 [Pectinophora gossypiella]
MPMSACSGGLVVTALVTLLLLPAQYYVPEFVLREERPPAPAPAAPAPLRAPPPLPAWPSLDLVYFPTLDLVLTFSLLLLGLLTYLCEWIQRKLMERRIVKLNQYLGASVERLRAWDLQQEQLESTLKMVQNATSEYNLLLYLLLRQHRCLANTGPPSNCFFDKELDDDLNFLRNPTLDT